MHSRYDARGEADALARWGSQYGETLALRTYSARLLGAEPSLVLHGGGNTSAKGEGKTRVGRALDVIFIKGSGWDLATIEPAGHPACELAPLRALRSLAVLSDEDMVAEQRRALLDPAAPNPSVECLLHAYLPHRFIDHTHADAILAIVDQRDAERICREIFGKGLVYVPYVMPGFALAQATAAAFDGVGALQAEVIVLGQHGIFTFGDSAKESYERMIDAVTRAEDFVRGKRSTPAKATAAPDEDQRLTRRILPILRGALAELGGPTLLTVDRSDVARAFVDDEHNWARSQIGTATPDHVIRTKPWPVILPRLDAAASDDELHAAVKRDLAAWSTRYQSYVEEGIAARGERKRLDLAPRVMLLPGVGVISAGATRKDADIARDIYAHTMPIIADADAVGAYQPVSLIDLFDLEYWPLEQAKLGKTMPKPLDGKIALVTGGGSGIGLAVAQLFLDVGAHVMLTDVAAGALSTARTKLASKYGNRVAACACDVTDEASVAEAFDGCIDAFGGVDVVVSNAGTAPQGLLHQGDGHRALEASMHVNFWGHQYVARRGAEIMLRQRRGGALLFNASKAAFNPGPAFGPYAIAKTAVVALMRQYAIDLGGKGIRSNAVNADRIRTGLFGDGVLEARAKARGLSPDDYFKSNLLVREVTARDVADAFLYLATAASTTGCIVTVDGGNAAAFPR